jgi:hypothetical protein
MGAVALAAGSDPGSAAAAKPMIATATAAVRSLDILDLLGAPR